MTTHVYECAHCGVTSIGIKDSLSYACRNDFCPDKWWNRLSLAGKGTAVLRQPTAVLPADGDDDYEEHCKQESWQGNFV